MSQENIVSGKIIPQIILFLGINGLFILKYVGRTSYNPILLLILYCAFSCFVIITFFHNAQKLNKNGTNILIGLLTLALVLGISLLNYFINPLDIMVDRWSAIHNVIHNLFIGQYPYSAHTHLNGYGSPFPIWQLFHIPFYLLGNIAFAMIFSVLLLIYTLVRFTKNKKSSLLYLLLLTISPAFWYEVAVRSDLFYNFLLVLIAIIFFQKKNYIIDKNSILLGAICGLFLSTRLSIIIPFFIYFFQDFTISRLKNKTGFIFMIIFCFVVSFLPLVFWDFDTLFFFKYNPFVLQSRQGSFLEVIIIGSLSVYLALTWKNDFLKFNAFTAYAITALVSVTFLHNMINTNFENHLFSPAYDITYFNMALPFLIFSIAYRFRNITEDSKLKP